METATTLYDSSSRLIGHSVVSESENGFDGTIRLDGAPQDVGALFAEFEELVNGQVLSLLDEVEERINALGVRAAATDGREFPLARLHVYPADGAVFFVPAPVGALRDPQA